MLALDFRGSRTLVDTIDRAVDLGDDRRITDALRDALCRMIRERSVDLPACVMDANPEHYARRELYRSEGHGYSVVAMTWGPGQGTPVHDHSGLWCVEGVWHGALEITQYEIVAREGERYRFQRVGAVQAGTGSAGSLIPPHEYHTIRNPSPDAVAVSLHIYKAPITCCSMFSPLGDDWYERAPRELALDRTT